MPAAFDFDDGQIGEVEALDMKTARLEVIRRIAEAGEKSHHAMNDCKIELAGAFWQGGPLRPDAATRPVEGLERHRFEGLELQGKGVGQRVTDGAPANRVHGRQRGDADPARGQRAIDGGAADVGWHPLG